MRCQVSIVIGLSSPSDSSVDLIIAKKVREFMHDDNKERYKDIKISISGISIARTIIVAFGRGRRRHFYFN
jgi:hypothetical protein